MGMLYVGNSAIRPRRPATSGAVISADGVYRYELWRVWDDGLPLLGFAMANPSKADHETNDPTITRNMNRACSLGYGGIVVGNVDAYRTPTPERLRDARKRGIDVVGPENADYLHGIATCCEAMVVAWGALPLAEDVDRALAILRDAGVPLYHLGLTRSGRPRHPLYVPSKQPLVPYDAFRRDVEAIDRQNENSGQ